MPRLAQTKMLGSESLSMVARCLTHTAVSNAFSINRRVALDEAGSPALPFDENPVAIWRIEIRAFGLPLTNCPRIVSCFRR